MRANNNLIYLADEVWTFGQIADGVFHEVVLAHKNGKKVRHFSCGKKITDIKPLDFASLEFEQELLDAYSRQDVVAQMRGRSR